MTEETINNITQNASYFVSSLKVDRHIKQWIKEANIAGAMHQDPVAEKRGYNQAIDDAIELAKNSFLVRSGFEKELEKLKR